jgi:pimeloyl-ACP methyl ester carboxylesterase
MPALRRPDGAEIHWEPRGDGPGVLVMGLYYSPPDRLEGLVADLARDHRVISYHPRGVGRSSRHGPYDAANDDADLEALLAEAGGATAAVVLGDASNRAIRVAARRPELLRAVLVSGAPALNVATTEGTEALVGSSEVLKALVQLLEVDYRAGLRQILANAGAPGSVGGRDWIDEAVAHCPQDVAVVRMREWIAADTSAEAQDLGDRLWILYYEGNPWFPAEVTERVRVLLPEARFERVDDGAINRPELTAAVVRRITQRTRSAPAHR